ncbi:hypothetical protein POTOM_061567 [Populus tomentosa]|uniref:Protein kinase domain-containing protein n=1 Tax=Populus tomentosa TaxID=118781 RepID=A0A8X8C050_POPTO|nr:hypothetical protein POTOM_061567 [Populus tomentosa]
MAATAAINGVGFCSFSDNLSKMKLIKRRSNGIIIGARSSCSRREVGTVLGCSSPSKAVLDRVSIGLGGRADEVVFEAIVKDSNSPLYNIKVVLRKLVSTQAKRRGMRAIEVLKKLVRRKLMYHSYSMQFHGYISSPSSGRGSFTLAHGYHGSFSLRHWLQQSDLFPTLVANLALDEDSVRRVGDDTVGGPAISQQLRMTRILMRDLLIGVNYLQSHGLSDIELRLENVRAYKPRG